MAVRMEKRFGQHGWPAQWRDGIYDFHHYHSTAHEVLGFAAGQGRIILGGERGHAVTVSAGDVALLPAGTGHCRLEASPDFLVIGAYPEGQTWDICRTAATESTLDRMQKLPIPSSDPVQGVGGSLCLHWRAS